MFSRLLVTLIFACFIPCLSHAQLLWENDYVHFAFYYDGYWGKWKFDS